MQVSDTKGEIKLNYLLDRNNKFKTPINVGGF